MSLDFAATLVVKPIVSLRTDNDEVPQQWSEAFGPLPPDESYIAMAARTLPLCGAETFIRPEMLGEAGLVMM